MSYWSEEFGFNPPIELGTQRPLVQRCRKHKTSFTYQCCECGAPPKKKKANK